ncbi:MAG: hypothetical protein ABH851_02745 [Methanobacteriota archaeon]
MNPRFRGGQTSLEFTIIYAVVVFVIIIGALAVWKTGVLKPNLQSQNTAIEVIGFSQIRPTDAFASSISDEIRMRLVNEGGYSITIPSGGLNITVRQSQCTLYPTSDVLIDPGGNFTAVVYCEELQNFNDGDIIKALTTINYTNTVSGTQYPQSKGVVYLLVGPVT